MSNLQTTASTSELASLLDEVASEHKIGAKPRVILALDATMSRFATWDMASNLTAGMIREAQP
jgi:hypothetical protein